MKTLFAIFISTLTPVFAIAAGGWAGGGTFVRDSENPWFLRNTKVVQYCVKIDETHFGISKKIAEERIAQAIEYWKSEFAISRSIVHGHDIAGVATQNFIQTECSDFVDLQFLLGVLPDGEAPKDWIPTSFIGLTVRTEYNRVTMKGRGFIYVSPGNGPLKYNNKDSVDNAWALQDGHAFRVIMMHELGHVFGFQHNSGGNPYDLMHSSYPESLIAKKTWDKDSNCGEWLKNYRPAIFKFRTGFEGGLMMCIGKTESTKRPFSEVSRISESPNDVEFNGDSLKFFGLPDHGCIGYGIKNSVIEVFGSNGLGQNSFSLGTASVEWHEPLLPTDSLIRIWLPSEQTVFSSQEWPNQILSSGYRIDYLKFRAQYKSTDGKIKRSLFGRAAPGGQLEIGGVKNGKTYLRIL